MTREALIEAFAMRVDGATFAEIAGKFGVTAAGIMQNLDSAVHQKRRIRTSDAVNKIVYPNIRHWIKHEGITLRKFTCMLGYISNQTYVTRMLYGNVNLSASLIVHIIEATGMTYAEVVERSDKE